MPASDAANLSAAADGLAAVVDATALLEATFCFEVAELSDRLRAPVLGEDIPVLLIEGFVAPAVDGLFDGTVVLDAGLELDDELALTLG